MITLEVPGGPIAALRAGDPDAPAALLVPGFTGSKEDFAPILEPLAAAGLNAVAIDLPGQYESSSRNDYSVRALGSDVRAVAALLGGRVHLLGHSFGGYVARAAVIDEPGRFASLALLDTGPAGIDGRRRALIELLRPVQVEHGTAAVYEALMELDAALPGYVAPSPAQETFLHRRFLSNDPAGLLAMGTAVIEEPDRVDELAATGLPLLVLTGVDDDAFPTVAQAEMAKRLSASYVEVPDAGHSPAAENPTATAAALISFWR